MNLYSLWMTYKSHRLWEIIEVSWLNSAKEVMWAKMSSCKKLLQVIIIAISLRVSDNDCVMSYNSPDTP